MIHTHCQDIVVTVHIVVTAVTAHIDPDRVTIRIRHTILLPQLQEVQHLRAAHLHMCPHLHIQLDHAL
jgi:hypothetical protein